MLLMKVVRKAVYNMLPKNRLRTPRMERLYIYGDDKHPHEHNLVKRHDEDWTEDTNSIESHARPR